MQERSLSKESAEGTLWEGEELALRFILEDGKLNLVIRCLEAHLAYADAHAWAAVRVSAGGGRRGEEGKGSVRGCLT